MKVSKLIHDLHEQVEKLEEENEKMRSLIVDYEIKLAQKSD